MNVQQHEKQQILEFEIVLVHNVYWVGEKQYEASLRCAFDNREIWS